MRKRGFTLVELLIVIIVIAVLAAIAIPKFADRGIRARESATKADLRLMRTAIENFSLDTGTYPLEPSHLSEPKPPEAGLDRKGNKVPISEASWHGPYLEPVPNSSITGKPFEYSTDAGTVGKVTHPEGKASDGTNYADW